MPACGGGGLFVGCVILFPSCLVQRFNSFFFDICLFILAYCFTNYNCNYIKYTKLEIEIKTSPIQDSGLIVSVNVSVSINRCKCHVSVILICQCQCQVNYC